MNLSLAVGVAMLIGKGAAWWLTGSTAIMSDAAESIIHVFAVAFASFSLRIAARPASDRFFYGYEKISFFSAGFEGALITIAAITIIGTAIEKWMRGLELERLSEGAIIVAAASGINLALGWYLVRVGKREHNIILEANGQHVLTDSWTSFGVIIGLVLVLFTGWKPFDPICAIVVALQILYSGGRLMISSIKGLLDYADPEVCSRINLLLTSICHEYGVEFHEMRFRSTGQRLLVRAHLLFPANTPIGEAHKVATIIEKRVATEIGQPCELETHLESLEDHAAVHGHQQMT